MDIQGNQHNKDTQINNNLQAFHDEVVNLNVMNEKIENALSEARDTVNLADDEYMNLKRYMADYRGELDPHEMFQNSLLLREIDHTGANKVGVLKVLEKIKESPYFARIDFQESGEEKVEIIYIGRFSFLYEYELLIVDWRSPIASMYYDYESGPAHYIAPVGVVNGTIRRKRQFKISNGSLDYAIESSTNIQDDLLRQVLSHTSDEKMKSIISTIQKEQNQIVRNEEAKSIIIQGVAGSGKTSIALHRISFLLYRFKEQLSGRNVTILSPNKVFGDYISTVLPELGDEPIYELSFVDIATMQLQGIIKFELDKDPLEIEDTRWAQRVQFKSTLEFANRIDLFLEDASSYIMKYEDYVFKDINIAAQFLNLRFQTYRKTPFKKRLQLVANDIYQELEKQNDRDVSIPKPAVILKTLKKMMKIKNTLALYKAFYAYIEQANMFILPNKQTLEWADVYPYLYFYMAYEGMQDSKVIKHLVIDEMQDYTPIQYKVINRLFPCQKTILGDFFQRSNPNHLHTMQDVISLFQDTSFVELTKSYRSTYEIITFANHIMPLTNLEPIERHGDIPVIIACNNAHDIQNVLENEIAAFHKSTFASLGIILKSNTLAKALYEELSIKQNLNLISLESNQFKNGVSITSIHMSKGLEFDAVILMDINDDAYKDEHDKHLLYIAMTRAMHKLTVLHTGKVSSFLKPYLASSEYHHVSK